MSYVVTSVKRNRHHHAMKPPPAAEAQTPIVAKGGEESCRTCLYTGVATCAGLSAYFLHLAYEEQPPSQKKPTDATTRKYPSKDINIPRSTNTPTQATTIFERAMKSMHHKSPPKSNRQFHLAFSAAWAVAGVYRLYLN